MDDTALLCKETITVDSIGNEKKALTQRQVYCKSRSLTRSEFYNAEQTGLNPELVLILSNRVDYDGEKVCIFHGETYSVIRTYWTADSDEIELTLERKVKVYG